MKKTFFIIFLWFLISGILLFLYFSFHKDKQNALAPQPKTTIQEVDQSQLIALPKSKILQNDYHIFQSFNNCGPAALSMTLSYFGIHISQETLGQQIRPYQVANGDNDDKSVTLDELAKKADEYDFLTFHRPNGNPELIKQFINNDMPVITRTWLHVDDDIGHYRVMKGFDDTTQEFIQDDSFQNKNLHYSYDEFNILWEKFNYEYLVLVPKDKQQIAEEILGEDRDELHAWQKAVELSQKQLVRNPDNIYARFNLSVAYYHLKNYKASVSEFEKVESQLPFRTLWYQIEPIQAYYELKNYDHVFEISNKILTNQNRAFSELYLLRGNSYKNLGNIPAAKEEFEKAVFYNTSLKDAQEALNSL